MGTFQSTRTITLNHKVGSYEEFIYNAAAAGDFAVSARPAGGQFEERQLQSYQQRLWLAEAKPRA